MEVKITFDTEKESVEDLNRLIAALQDLVEKKVKAVTLGNPLASLSVTKPAQAQQPQQTQQQRNVPAGGQTAGGGRVIPYQDISNLMDKVLSGKR